MLFLFTWDIHRMRGFNIDMSIVARQLARGYHRVYRAWTPFSISLRSGFIRIIFYFVICEVVRTSELWMKSSVGVQKVLRANHKLVLFPSANGLRCRFRGQLRFYHVKTTEVFICSLLNDRRAIADNDCRTSGCRPAALLQQRALKVLGPQLLSLKRDVDRLDRGLTCSAS